jgi:hypothetical protein
MELDAFLEGSGLVAGKCGGNETFEFKGGHK